MPSRAASSRTPSCGWFADLREQRRLAAGDPLGVRLAAQVTVQREQNRRSRFASSTESTTDYSHFVTYGNEMVRR
jgi:hypothetical protein